MKHILNEMSEEEKNSIRSQHTGSLQVQTERFKKLVENKLGNAKPLISEDFDNIDYGRTKNGLGPDNEELEEDMIDDEDEMPDDEDEMPDDEDEENIDEVITVDDIYEEIILALKELGDYNESMDGDARELSKTILNNMKDDLAYVSDNYEEQLYDILEGAGDESDEDEDMMDLGISESYLNEDYDSDAILNPTSIKYSKNPKVDDFLESVFPGLNTEETMNAFRRLLRNDELWEEFSRLMRMFGYDSYHNKEEIFDKVNAWAKRRGNERGNDEEIW